MMNVIYLGGLFVLSKPYGNDTSYRLRIASLILRQHVIRYGRDPTSTCLVPRVYYFNLIIPVLINLGLEHAFVFLFIHASRLLIVTFYI